MKYSYARIYNTAFYRVSRGNLNHWLQRRLQPTKYHITNAWTRHINTLINTQSIGHLVNTQTRDTVQRQMRLCELARIFCARKLQTAILRHVWRPGGRLFWKHAPQDMLTPTRDAG